MKARLEQESATSQRELALRQQEEFQDMERRQEDMLQMRERQHKDSLRRLESKVETALKLQESMQFQEAQSSLRSILSECVDARGQSPLSMSAEPAELSAPPTADQLIPPTATSLDLEVKPEQIPPTVPGMSSWPSPPPTGELQQEGSFEALMKSPRSAELRGSDAVAPPSSAGSLGDRDKSRQGTVRCNRCSALNMINLEGPPTVQCGSCAYEFTAQWEDMLSSRVLGSGGLEKVAEENEPGGDDAPDSPTLCGLSPMQTEVSPGPSPLMTEVSPRITEVSPRITEVSPRM